MLVIKTMSDFMILKGSSVVNFFVDLNQQDVTGKQHINGNMKLMLGLIC